MEDMTRVEKFEKMLPSIDYYIKECTGFIYDNIDDPTTAEIIECLRDIILHNIDFLERKKQELLRKRQIIKDAKSIFESKEVPEIEIPESFQSRSIPKRDLADLKDLLSFSDLDSETEKKLTNLSQEDKIRLKLHFYQQIIKVKKQIRTIIMNNPSSDISKLQEELMNLEFILEFIAELEQEEIEKEQINHPETSNIIFVPNKNTTYFYEDILGHIDSKKEIKNIFDKLIDGYFLKTKDTRALEGYQEYNLYEYKHPNGIRILYVVAGNIICICSLFYKDKQKSIKIDNYYEEAVKRFLKAEPYINENYNNPDFYIEQEELISQIKELLEPQKSLLKKVGDDNE